jgi:Tol biopolymer transport system component
MNESMDRVLAEWLREGPELGPREALERTLAATRRTGQRPGWTLPERWFPMLLTMQRSPSLRPMAYLVVVVLILTAIVAAALIGSPPPLPDPFGPARNGAVVYERNGDILIADALGGDARVLAGSDEPESLPLFSRQGDRIAYLVGEPRSGVRLMAVDPDGSNRYQVAGPVQQVFRFEWSSDGSRLVIGHADHGFPAISVAAADGSAATELDVGMSAEWPTWRPGTDQIAFRGQPVLGDDAVAMFLVDHDGSDLHTIDLSGSGARIFTYDAPSWSTDGSQLSFLRNAEATSGDWRSIIADVAPDGRVTALRELDLVPDSTMEILPVWSPDSTDIAYLVERDGMRQVAIAPADGRTTARLVGPSRAAGMGGFGYAWSPDGTTLLVTFLPIEGSSAFWALDVESGAYESIEGPTVEIPSWQRLSP